MGFRRAMEIAVDQRPRVHPFVADVAASALLARVRDDPALGLTEAVDLHLEDVDPSTSEGLVELRGPSRSAAPLLGDLSLLLVGEGRSGRPSSGVETRHNPRLAPPLKEFAKPSGGDSPTGRHLPASFVGDRISLGLTD